MVIVITLEKTSKIYGRIKYVGDVIHSIPTQFIIEKNVRECKVALMCSI